MSVFLDFPSTPVVGQIYGFATKVWQWNGTGWAAVNIATQVGISFMAIHYVDQELIFPSIADDFVLLVHI